MFGAIENKQQNFPWESVSFSDSHVIAYGSIPLLITLQRVQLQFIRYSDDKLTNLKSNQQLEYTHCIFIVYYILFNFHV